MKVKFGKTLFDWFSVKYCIYVLIGLGFLVYINAVRNDFVFDDQRQIVVNNSIQSVTNIPQFFGGSTFFSGGAEKMSGGYYRPLMMTFYSVIFSIFGPEPSAFHLFQILFHIANAVLIFLLFKKFFTNILSFVLALLFLVHPINSETVVYAANLQDVLFVLFGLLSFLFISNTGDNFLYKKPKLTLFSLVLLSMFSKETGIVFGLLLILYAYLYKKDKLGSFITSIGSAFVLYLLLKVMAVGLFPPKNSIIPIMAASLPERLQTIPKVIVYYFQTYIFPKDLMIFQIWTVKTITFEDFILPLFLTIAFASALFLFWKKVKPEKSLFLGFQLFLVWMLVGLLMHSQIFPLSATVSDRWFYFTQIGLLGIFGVVITTYYKYIKRFMSYIAIVSVIIFLLLSSRTVQRNFDWKTELSISQHDLQFDTDNFLLENAYGYNLLKTGSYDNAVAHFKNVTTNAPRWGQAWNNLGYAYESKGDGQSLLEAKGAYQKSINLSNSYLAYANLTNVLIKVSDYATARETAEKGLRLYPNNPQLWYFLVITEYKTGDKDLALKHAQNLYNKFPSTQNYNLLQEIQSLQ